MALPVVSQQQMHSADILALMVQLQIRRRQGLLMSPPAQFLVSQSFLLPFKEHLKCIVALRELSTACTSGACKVSMCLIMYVF